MSKYVSWTNVLCVWALACLQLSLWLGNYGKDRTFLVVLIMGFVTAYTTSDIIGRYLSLKSKEQWKPKDKDDM